MDAPKPTTAFLGTLYVGTDRLERPLTDAERRDLSSLLRKHDFVGASLVSLRFAFTLRHSHLAAHDLKGRANLRLVRRGWDPSVVPLADRLCRLVWCEHQNETRESAAARRAEETFLDEQRLAPAAEPSAEDRAVRLEEARREEERGKERILALRADFVEAGDTVNLLWLDYRLTGIDEPAEMARRSGRDIGEFYRAAERRKRHTARLLEARTRLDSKEKK